MTNYSRSSPIKTRGCGGNLDISSIIVSEDPGSRSYKFVWPKWTEVDRSRVLFPTGKVLRVRLHFCRFMEPVVLLSDVSLEFPKNTSSAFKVCLPHPVQFDGNWEVGVVSVSVPDQEIWNWMNCSIQPMTHWQELSIMLSMHQGIPTRWKRKRSWRSRRKSNSHRWTRSGSWKPSSRR